MSFAIIINSFKANTQQTFPPWWILGYLILSIHHYMRLSMFCHAGDHLRRELFKTLTLISQFGFVQNDTALLALAIARKPDQLLTVGGYCRLDRTCLSKLLFLVLLAVIAISNFKLYEFKTL
ncbi:uncharacterized protein LOC111705272 [Eurytemora carolleeae]|uniref:uncharacterized protein LOC111705272 n=1 Tax=Eurytemora carolleeae TaxID=1294199 RepID=UPI000C75DFA4|nr:uncharacterized protein LOC111705272 [Eurytemora carolleeae]|eukprot:XP_023333547.1 uncharacterized protein LOC111705272 [Eurytemora affinis]